MNLEQRKHAGNPGQISCSSFVSTENTYWKSDVEYTDESIRTHAISFPSDLSTKIITNTDASFDTSIVYHTLNVVHELFNIRRAVLSSSWILETHIKHSIWRIQIFWVLRITKPSVLWNNESIILLVIRGLIAVSNLQAGPAVQHNEHIFSSRVDVQIA
jgi:hypothetical protein